MLLSATLNTLASFDGTNGAFPLLGGLVFSDSTLYGTTSQGGANGDGVVFSLPLGGGTPTVLASFNGGGSIGGLILANGMLYGTAGGGANGDGEVFSLPVGGGTPTVLASFNGSDGALPWAGLILSGGMLYGTTWHGGANGDGVVFSLPVTGGTPTVLASFDGSNGQGPRAGLTVDGGTLYGTASGANGYTEVFSVPVTGGTPTVLALIDISGGTPGRPGIAGLVLSGGTLYGTTFEGGANDYGEVFSVPVGGGTPTVLASFNGSDGSSPEAGVVLCGGTLYGTTSGGGTGWDPTGENYGDGVVFSVPVGGGTPTVLASFNYANGSSPRAGLVISGDTLYGTTALGETYGDGTVFAITGADVGTSLAAPALVNPSAGTTGVSTMPTFSWSEVSGNLGYRIVVSTNATDLASDPTQQGNLTPANGFNETVGQDATNYTWTGTLTPDTTYYWEVHALGSDLPTAGVWSGVQSFTTAANSPSSTAEVVGYLADSEVADYRSPAELNSIYSGGLNRINYFGIFAQADGSLPSTSASGLSFSYLAEVVAAAHAQSPPVAVSITVVANSSSSISKFDTMDSSSTSITTFVNNIISFCDNYHLDGVDIDYEPGMPTSTEVSNFGSLVAALHVQTSADGLMLSVAVQAADANDPRFTVPVADIGDIDQYYVMDYDLESYASAPYNDSLAYLNGWADYGVPKSKLLMGIPFYGRTGTDPANPTLTYAGILRDYASANGEAYPARDVDSVTVGGNTYGFNGITTIQDKVNYVLQNGYAGMMIFELGEDHFDSQGNYDQYSLLPAIKSAATGESGAPPWLTANAGANYTLSGNTLVVSGGSVTFTDDASSSLPNLGISVANGSSLLLSVSQDLASLIVSGGEVILGGGDSTNNTMAVPLAAQGASSPSEILTLNSLSTPNGGTLDLNDGELVIQYSGNPSPADAIAAQIASGYANGKWDGTGIISSTAANDNSETTGIGYFDDGTQVIVRRTWYGDANLDGVINADDLSLILLGQAQGGTRWQDGNFNYDTQVNADDWIELMYAVAYSKGQTLAAFSSDALVQSSDTGAVTAQLAKPTAPTFAETPIASDEYLSGLLDQQQSVLQ